MANNNKTSPALARDKEPRVELGVWLRSLREERGLSQRQLANQLSLDYYTFISQLETGRGKISLSGLGESSRSGSETIHENPFELL